MIISILVSFYIEISWHLQAFSVKYSDCTSGAELSVKNTVVAHFITKYYTAV